MTENAAHSYVIAPSRDTQEQKIMNVNYRELGRETESTGKLTPLWRALATAERAQHLWFAHAEMFYTQISPFSLFSLMHFLHLWQKVFPLYCTVIPVFLHPPQDVVAETGQDVAITCAAQGDPRPTITWVKVRDDTTYSTDTREQDGSSMGVLNNSLVKHLSQLN